MQYHRVEIFDEGLGPKRQSCFYTVVLEFFLCYSYLFDSTLLHTSIFAKFLSNVFATFCNRLP